jgi:ATP-binding cassette subfamily F protein 3
MEMGRLSVNGIPSGAQEASPGRRAFKTKEEKRLEAEERNRLSRITRALKDELAALEDRIAHLEAKQRENEKTLCAPDIHKEPNRIKKLNQDLLDRARELEPLYAAWDDLTRKLEAAQ